MKDENNTILNFSQSLQVGAVAGLAQSVFSLPFWAAKMRMQCGYSFTANPFILYKGFYPATASIMLMSVTQVGFCTGMHRAIHSNTPQTPETPTERILSALASGPLSTFIANPVGVVITQQHKHPGKKFFETANFLKNEFGYQKFYVSYCGNTIVNSFFTLGFYGAYPILNQQFSPVIACSALGVINAAVSQAFDTAKTLQEEKADQKSKVTLYEGLKFVKKTQGFRGLFRGFVPNSLSVGIATLCAGVAVEKAETLLRKK